MNTFWRQSDQRSIEVASRVPSYETATSRPLRVLLVAPALPIIGGQTVQAARLLDALRREPGLEVGFQPINPRFLPSLQKVKYLRTIVTSVKYLSDLVRKAPRCDIVHIFSASYYSFVLAPTPAVLVAKLFRKKTILNYRSGEARDHLTRWRRTALPTVRLFDNVITPSGYLVDVFSDFGIEARPVFNFVDLERFQFRKRSPLEPVFLSNRNFEPHYNVSCTLRAFQIIQDELPDSRLIVIGQGSQGRELRALAQMLRLRNVEFTGAVGPEAMPRQYDRADVYLNSPSIDNMPNSIIEAFACGLPVVSTDAGGIPYIVENGKTGLLVDVNDHAALAQAALGLFRQNGLAAGLVMAARRQAEKYSWKNVRSEWLRTYSDLIEQSA